MNPHKIEPSDCSLFIFTTRVVFQIIEILLGEGVTWFLFVQFSLTN